MNPYFKSWIIVVVAALTLGTASSAWATLLYGISFASPQGSVLYQVDPQTGQAGDPKPTGLSHVVGIAFSNDLALYGLTNATAPRRLHPTSFHTQPVMGSPVRNRCCLPPG